MDFSILHLALRELRQNMSQPKVILILCAATALCGLSGPFDTMTLPNAARFAYWAGVIFTTYGVGTVIHFALRSKQCHMVTIAGATGIVIAGTVMVLNITTLPAFPTDWMQRFEIGAISAIIAGIISMVLQVTLQKPNTRAPNDGRSMLIERLPYSKRGELISIHAEDHYVRVETTKGSEILLMRLADAIEMAAPYHGLRIHRSHWVVIDHVRDYNKSNEIWNITLSNGRIVPISRSFRGAAIKAGIIPARG